MMRRKLRNYLKWKREFAQVNALVSFRRIKRRSAVLSILVPAGRAPANKRRRVEAAAVSVPARGRLENGSIAQYFEKPSEVAELMAEIQINEDEANQKDDMASDPLEDMDDYYQLYRHARSRRHPCLRRRSGRAHPRRDQAEVHYHVRA